MRNRTKLIVIALAVLVTGSVAYAWYSRRSNGATVSFRTATVERGDLVITISSTGTVEPEEVIDVGAQVAGQISGFGKDADGKQVDHGSRVKSGAMMAQIDDSLYRSDVAVATAQVSAAKAGVQRAEADLKQAQAKLYQAQRDWERAQKIGPSEAMAEFSYDAYKATYESAVAAVSVADAGIAQAKGSVAQAEATLFRAERNLGYTTISSPVDGAIIERRVNIGQTVVSSRNAPSLFLLAKDLSHMQVWVAVNEADVGNIRPGQPVTFTVDTFAGRTFTGRVHKVRPKAEMTSNVVTYLVEVATDNMDGTLLPYLTANVKFEVDRHESVLKVPNGALRYTPSDERIAPAVRPEMEAKEKEAEAEAGENRGDRWRERSGGEPSSRPARPESKPGTIWVRDGEKYLRPIQVRAGVTDGLMTEVRGEGLAEGVEIITGEIQPDTAASGSTNPFGPPKFPRERQCR